MTSPPATVARACQAARLIEFLMKWTLPLTKTMLTPPGCRLRAVRQPIIGPRRQSYVVLFGVM